MTPATMPAHRNNSNEPNCVTAASTIATNPAAGPATLICDELKAPITIPPIMPDTTPESGGAPDANAIPRHKGKATKNTTKPEAKFCLNKRVLSFSEIIVSTTYFYLYIS